MFLTVLSPTILIFPGLFLFNTSVYKVVFPEKDPSAIALKMDSPPPIIMVVFDEFPVTALMDENAKIDPIRYPNFAALARDASWFRNATSLSAATTFVIPAMLSGNDPDRRRRQPTAVAYPNNIFTLLGGVYDLKVFEAQTRSSFSGTENLCFRVKAPLIGQMSPSTFKILRWPERVSTSFFHFQFFRVQPPRKSAFSQYQN